ncbi:hypothetical protein EMIT0111MI5_220097 [Burkholderia sp. IT-111MI5]
MRNAGQSNGTARRFDPRSRRAVDGRLTDRCAGLKKICRKGFTNPKSSDIISASLGG